jgi:hypothetical protein
MILITVNRRRKLNKFTVHTWVSIQLSTEERGRPPVSWPDNGEPVVGAGAAGLPRSHRKGDKINLDMAHRGKHLQTNSTTK